VRIPTFNVEKRGTEGFSDEFYVDRQNPRVEVEISELVPEVFAELD